MILRTYGCGRCNFLMEVELRSDQWDQAPPECPKCAAATYQEFKAPGIGGSNLSRAVALAEDIMAHDYHVADMQTDGKGIGAVPKVRYRDQASSNPPSQWGGVNQEVLEGAIALGRQNRLRFGGSGLDVLQHNLKTGAEPDLIKASKRRSIRVG